jgi:sarcosine dehydrogenase
MKCSINGTIMRATTLRRCVRSFSSPRSLPTEADAVVVGGGSIGASVLYHLAQRGLKALMLERDELTSGTTWHSAGMLWRLRPSDADIEMHSYTREMCIKLEEETGIASWTENGGLFIAGNAERLAEYERLAETGRYFGIESAVLSPAEVQKVHPLIAVDDVYGGLYSPTDGTIDPSGVVEAYTRAARKQFGAKVLTHATLVGIDTAESATVAGGSSAAAVAPRVTGVRVRRAGEVHAIRTPLVVNAAGAWAGAVAQMASPNSAKLPLRALKHAFVVTEAMPGMHGGLPNVRDHDLSIYLKAQGQSMAIGGYETNPEFWNPYGHQRQQQQQQQQSSAGGESGGGEGEGEGDHHFAFGLFELDYDTFGQNLEGHMQRCPLIAETGIKSTVCGPESFTPDHKPLVGWDPSGVRGLFHCCGFNSMGLMLGGGVGKEAAAWIDEGSPTLDLFSFDAARFHPDCNADDDWIHSRTHESYAKVRKRRTISFSPFPHLTTTVGTLLLYALRFFFFFFIFNIPFATLYCAPFRAIDRRSIDRSIRPTRWSSRTTSPSRAAASACRRCTSRWRRAAACSRRGTATSGPAGSSNRHRQQQQQQ